MRIAQIATVDTPVRRDHSGSIEQLVWLLARELTALGHEVTTFGARGGEVAGRFVETLPGTYAENDAPEDWRMCEIANIGRALVACRRSGETRDGSAGFSTSGGCRFRCRSLRDAVPAFRSLIPPFRNNETQLGRRAGFG